MKRKLTVAVLVALYCCLVSADTVKMGFSVKDITPEPKDIKNGIRAQGWGAARPTTIILDKLYVKTLAMRDKNNTLLVILTADTCKFHPGDAYMLKAWFAKKYKVSSWNLIMNASHTHQAPRYYLFSKEPYAKKYHSIFIKNVKASITEAVNNIKTPMIIKFAGLKINKNMIYNKVYKGYHYQAQRKKIIREGKSEGYKKLADKFNFVDTDFPVFAFFDAKTKKLSGFLWSIAAHPTYKLCVDTPISASVPGAVSEALSNEYGKNIISMFAQGAAGDIKMQFPHIDGKIKYKYFRKTKKRGHIWLSGKDKGKVFTIKDQINETKKYAKLFVDIIKKGFKDNKFKEIKTIDLKINGKEEKIALAEQRPPRRTKTGNANRCYWKRPPGNAADYQKIINSKKSSETEKQKAYEALFRIYDDNHAAYSVWFTKVQINKHLQIVAMSQEVCSEIGLKTKEYYRNKGIKTVFLGYSPWGTPYYPSNKHKAEGTYQGSWMHPEKDFDFNNFALDNIISIKFKE